MNMLENTHTRLSLCISLKAEGHFGHKDMWGNAVRLSVSELSEFCSDINVF